MVSTASAGVWPVPGEVISQVGAHRWWHVESRRALDLGDGAIRTGSHRGEAGDVPNRAESAVADDVAAIFLDDDGSRVRRTLLIGQRDLGVGRTLDEEPILLPGSRSHDVPLSMWRGR